MASIEIELGTLSNSCFVIMPFSATFNDEYEKVIKPAVESAGLVPIRGDEIYSRPKVMEDIWKALRSARIVVAELTGKNTNVFYEVGLAHTISKPVIIITRDEKDVPFDLKALRYLYYNMEDPFWGENLKTAISGMILQVLQEKEYGHVFEGIKIVGKIEYIQPEVEIEKEKELSCDLTGIWQGTMNVEKTEYNCNLVLVQKGEELSGALNVSCFKKEEAGEVLTLVQETVVGGVKNNSFSMYAVSYTYIQQGLSSGYSLDSFKGELSGDEDVVSGESIDENNRKGEFSFKKVKPKQEA
ncbi:MAG TPA: hypothetical protein VMX96_03470 [Dehalococcoidia bacterium]|nr:hypothetical protein [Dehalococcoidia bacterium]